MSKGVTRWLWVAIASLALVQPALAQGSRQLVGADWLKDNLKRGELHLIDASPVKLHAAGHIPGAVNVDVFSFGGRPLSVAEMERLIQSWGVSSGRKVVLYDQGGTYFATSLFFDLLHYGFPADSMAVLDGGLAKWRASGGEISKDPTPAPKPGTFRVTKVNEDVRVRLPEFLVASGDPASNALVEALDPAQHFGGAKFFDRAGHVPNAIMAPAPDFFNADKTFKSPRELRRMLDYLGIRPEQQVLTHCGGGIAASVPFFAMKFMLDYPNVKLYKESQLEWLRDDRGLPFWTYDAPQLLREASWLNGWGNAMIRSFGVSKLSVIDVRPPDAFKQAHVPFAINVPADVFRRHVAAPEKLAEILGAAGVDPAYEAVIVSSGGLNADSALAFVLLEKLGQKKVSLLLGSVDDWGLAGLPLEKDAKPAKATAYPARSVAAKGPGLYPKVLVAVPSVELVGADGNPKAAKDLWAALSKAGVPRYGELVSVADDAGEAAVGYFILKLMGYPDINYALR